MLLRRVLFCLAALIVIGHGNNIAQDTSNRSISVAVLDFGDSRLAPIAADTLSAKLKPRTEISLLDRDAARSAAKGAGYKGSLNLSLNEARDLGDAIGCDFYFTGDAQTLRRSVSSKPVYFESYASIFLVSSRSGKLVTWDRLSFEGADAETAEHTLLESLSRSELAGRYAATIQRTSNEEWQIRRVAPATTEPAIEEAPEDEKAAEASGLQMPKPYRRLRPAYPETAARADAEAVVDVKVDLDVTGEVTRVAVERWAGFGLDDATIETVRQLHFFPAMRDGKPIPIRVLLRYNFRKSAR